MGTNGYMINPFMLTTNLGDSSSMYNNYWTMAAAGVGGSFSNPMASFNMFGSMNPDLLSMFMNPSIMSTPFPSMESGCGQYVIDHKKMESKFSPVIEKYAKQYGLDPNVMKRLVKQESAFNPYAKSKAGAQGLMQLMPGTARDMGVTNPYDPEQNIAGGTKYFAKMVKRYNGDYRKALAAYNGGTRKVDKYGVDFCKETANYHRKILGSVQAQQNPFS